MIHRLLVFVTLLLVGQVFAAGNAGPDLELICPCTYSSASSSSANVQLGVLNRGDSATGELIVRAYAHTEASYFDSDDREFLGNLRVTDSLAATSEIGLNDFQMRLDSPPTGDYYVTFLLLADNFIQDVTRTDSLVTFGSVASQTFNDLYFVEDPTMEIDGNIVTLNVPAIGNSGSTDEVTQISLTVSDQPDFFGGGFFRVGEYTDVTEVRRGERSEAGTAQFEFNAPDGFVYYNLVVTDGTFTTLLHTVSGPDVEFTLHDFSATSVDFLTDSDGDGVADDNELIAGTDVGIGSSTPGKSYIDILAVHDTSVTSFYDGDPSARLDHLIAVSNAAMEDSKVDIVFRLADTEEVSMDTSRSIGQWLNAAESGSDVYGDLQQRRGEVGADLITLFRLYDGGDICGLATLGGFATQGLMTRTEHISATFIEFDECGDITMVHEIGHNMGLGHSFAQNKTGTFNWSRGHGEQGVFTTLMGYATEFGVFTELPYFSNPNIRLCEGSACGVDRDEPTGADAAASLNAVRFQVANFMASNATDSDGDGVPDSVDAFSDNASETVDTDADGLGNNADYDDDNDGMPDTYEIAQGLDPLVNDASLDANGNDRTNLEDFLAVPRATQFLQTNSISDNVSRVHIVNTSDSEQEFTGTLYQGSGARLGSADQSLGFTVAPKGRLILDSDDLEMLFGIDAWAGPAMLEVSGSESFAVMAKLESPSGLVSNTNCVRETRSINLEGFDSDNLTFVRFINTGNGAIENITGTLYDVDGGVIGTGNVELISSLAPKQQVFVNRGSFAELVGAEWQGEAMLEVADKEGLKLLNLNFVNGETFFNFSCFESSSANANSDVASANDSTSADGSTTQNGRIYLQTSSTSANDSLTHIVNTDEMPQQFVGTLYDGDGTQLGEANQPLHSGLIASKGRLILSSAMIEEALTVDPWKGPAMLEVQGAGTFELMTKLASPSGLVSNTNCVRQDQVHNIEGADSPNLTFVRIINTGNQAVSPVTGSLFDLEGAAIGDADSTLLENLDAKEQVFLNRNHLSDVFGGWNGEAALTVEGGTNLKLLNLNFINSETFFNFSCYETAD